MTKTDDWRYRAACQGMDTSAVFYNCESSTAREAAKAVCAGCPVRAECLKDVMTREATGQSPKQNLKGRYGVCGGLSAGERWAIAYPEAAEEERKKEKNRKHGPPSRYIQDLSVMAEEAA